MYECTKEWKSVPTTPKKYFHCLGDGGNLYEESDLSPGSTTQNGVTRLRGCNSTDGYCHD